MWLEKVQTETNLTYCINDPTFNSSGGKDFLKVSYTAVNWSIQERRYDDKQYSMLIWSLRQCFISYFIKKIVVGLLSFLVKIRFHSVF